MVPFGHAAAFTVASFLLIVIPGPSVVFTIGRALSAGKRDALLTVVGDAAGVYLQVIAVAFGIGALVQRSVAAFTAIKIVGAIYLLYLGIQGIRHRHSLAETLSRPSGPTQVHKALADGFIVGVANPKSVVFLAALLPEFTDRHAGNLQFQLLVLGAIFSVVAWACTSAWALIAGTASSWFARSPRRMAAIGGTGGLMLIGLGIGTAVTGRVK